ncbi:hypothetical protein [uncultured Mediterranean phage uvMED]|nr:hypothetical protein [uncultured Mediterranean phage uvMED]
MIYSDLKSPNVNNASESTQGRVTFAKNVKTTMPFTRSKRWMTKVKQSKKRYSRKEAKNANSPQDWKEEK